MKSIFCKRSILLGLFLASVNSVEAGVLRVNDDSADLRSNGLLMLQDTGVPVTHALIELQGQSKKDSEKNLVLVENGSEEKVDVGSQVQSEEGKLKKIKNKNKQTTLTIVQDFPKKRADASGMVNINLLQNNQTVNITANITANDTKPMAPTPIASPYASDDKNSTTLIIG